MKKNELKAVIRYMLAAIVVLIAVIVFLSVKLKKTKADAENVKIVYNESIPTQTIEKAEPTPIITDYEINTEPDDDTDYLQLVNLENYIYELPDNLDLVERYIDDDLAEYGNSEILLNTEVINELKDMLEDAKAQGIPKYIINSGFRSIRNQTRLWNNRKESDPNYGKQPYENPLKCMPPNSSEHSTGLAVDILNTSYREANDGYGDTLAGKWMYQNAYKYGFILRYPENKTHITGVMYEPWHYRYVGKEVAKEIYEREICLEEYLNKTP